MPIKKAYLDTNIINRAQKCGLSGLRLREVIEKHSFAPAVGLHTIYELSRTLLTEDGKHRGAGLLQILHELDPYYQLSPEMLHDQEIIKLRTGAAVLPFLDHLDLVATKQEVGRLALGFFDDGARNFIAGCEAEIRENHPKFASGYIAESKDTLNRSPSDRSGTFEDFYSKGEDQIPGLIYQSLNGKVTRSEAYEIYSRINSFPAIRTTVRSNVYLCWICVNPQGKPRKDKLDDYRHIIEASYCNIFVTDDKQLSSTVPRINPDLEVLKGRQFF